MIMRNFLCILVVLLYTSCDSQSSSITNDDDTISIVSDDAGTPSSEREKKEFTSSFENVEDF